MRLYSLTRNRVINLSLFALSISAALFLGEIALRIFYPHKQFSSLYLNVNEQSVFPAYPLYPGLNKHFSYTSNSSGYRSKHLFNKENYGVLAIGGSTTECLYLGDENGWTQILETHLNTSNTRTFAVGNVGSAGLTAPNHYLQIKHLVPQYKYIDMVIVLVGINDLLRTLNLKYANTIPTLEENYRRTFKYYPRTNNEKWYRKTELWMHIRDVKNGWRNLFSNLSSDSLISISDNQMKLWKNATQTDHLPNLDVALNLYEENIRSMAMLADEYKVRLVLITQPVLWSDEMSEKEEQLAIFGIPPINNGVAFSTKALAKGMELYNDRLRKVATNMDIPLIDLAKVLPKNTSVFYDYCHFNLDGAKKVADTLYTHLKPLIAKRAIHGN